MKRNATFLEEQVSLFEHLNRQSHNSGTASQRADANLNDKIKNFAATIADENTYRNLLRLILSDKSGDKIRLHSGNKSLIGIYFISLSMEFSYQ